MPRRGCYEYHLSFRCLRSTIGLVIKIAIVNPTIVRTSWTLLKLSLNTSKVFDGARRVKNRS